MSDNEVTTYCGLTRSAYRGAWLEAHRLETEAYLAKDYKAQQRWEAELARIGHILLSWKDLTND